MPPKRRAPALPEASSTKKAPRSKLAKEHNITGEEENEIREAFKLFSQDSKGNKEGVIPIGDVRRAMIALDIPPTTHEIAEFVSILDPENDGYALYSSFVAICALKLHSRTRTSDSHTKEVDEAFRLFVGSGGRDGLGGDGEKITLATLKQVARSLKEEVDESVLRDMILEANGGAGVGTGVDREEFEGVMRRAGVWR